MIFNPYFHDDYDEPVTQKEPKKVAERINSAPEVDPLKYKALQTKYLLTPEQKALLLRAEYGSLVTAAGIFALRVHELSDALRTGANKNVEEVLRSLQLRHPVGAQK